jgi:hypothetical protein
MTNEEGRELEGAPEHPPKAGAGAPSGVDWNGPKRHPGAQFQNGMEVITMPELPRV